MAKIDKSKTDFFLFGGEESFGYLPVSFVRDKDSLSSALLLLEILTEKRSFKLHGRDLSQIRSLSRKSQITYVGRKRR
ncbi:phosphoglucomutase/phosphomannomutase, alpha/beta/alpha domain III protein [Leptospira weilii str. Ecochallenge]|uniref:Phosphoglucomutase/phosphomannomutase, alpha/beta/alpha domain III protein n=1 Tax=Leptospira weilii str. Ecochallenge TaxID=1049986 RepID=N1U9L4_9LEPT|nr:phosphoglucomutase/phosphomannomutase, alpha/beta/alpha domain III protein [Leptospira weilii str. Ecochallenge]